MVNLIAINGYSGSGKDLVGRIIQYLIFKQVSGSDEEFKISYSLARYDTWSGWEIKKYAAKLKQIASILTGIPVEKFEDQEFKKTNLGPEWDYPTKFTVQQGHPRIDSEYKPRQVRNFLQILGTEAIRDQIHPNTWGNALFVDYIPNTFPNSTTGRLELEWPKWIITDLRYVNEAEIAKSKGSILIRVNREGCKPINNHPSENSLDNYNFDYYIENNGTIENLIEIVRKFLIDIKVLEKDDRKTTIETV